MQTPIQITFRGLSSTETLEAKIRQKVGKLEDFHPMLTSCRVVVEKQALHQHQGRLFNVRLDLRVPGHELAVNRDHDEDLHAALNDAFDAARRMLEDELQIRRGEIKGHEPPPRRRAPRMDMGGRRG